MNQNKIFFRKLWIIAIPIAIQNFIVSSLNIVDVMMIGKLGKDQIAGVGLANQVFFILMLLMFGISGGASTFIAQFWGKRNLKNIHKTLGIALCLAGFISFIFSILALFIPETLIRIYSSEKEVIKYGADYLRIVGTSFIATAIYFQFATAIRSIGRPKIALFSSLVALIINISLNYVLIFGKFGFPEMGVKGAALATVVARLVETILLTALIYLKKTEVASTIKELFSWNLNFAKRFIKISNPIIFQELLWALGTTSYYIIYGRISSDAVAAMNIFSSVERMAFVLFFGLSMASGVMIGEEIGKDNEKLAYEYSKKVIFLFPIIAIVLSLPIFFTRNFIVEFYSIPEVVKYNSKMILMMFCFVFPLKVFNLTNLIGILRSGGDTKVAFLLDIIPLWLIGVPIAYFTGLKFGLPIYLIYLLINIEELVKSIFSCKRVFSKKWMKNIVNDIK